MKPMGLSGALRLFCTRRNFPRRGHFLLFKGQLAESGRLKIKENIIPRGKFCPVENSPNVMEQEKLLILIMSQNIFLSPAVSYQNFLIDSERFEQGRPFRPLSKLDI